MSKLKLQSYKTVLIYVFTTIVLFGIHFNFENSANHTILFWSYGFNTVITLFYLIFITYLGEALKHQIGFIFLGVATFKIILFLIIQFVSELKIENDQFLIFFIPYFMALAFEILLTKKILDHISYKK